MTNKIFLDCGAWYNGYSVEVFRQLYDVNYEYFIYSFEANPLFTENFPYFNRHMLCKKAVWIYDGFVDFYIDNSKKRAGSTIIKEKVSGELDKKNPIRVECIDFDRWIKNNFVKEDFIICKFDIELAEYYVLPHMIKNGSIEYIDKLFIEWHWNKSTNISKKEHDGLVRQINDLGIPIVERWKV
jgi:FkbM family methyltransferase